MTKLSLKEVFIFKQIKKNQLNFRDDINKTENKIIKNKH